MRVGNSSFRHWWVAAIIVAGWLPWLLWQARLLWTAWRTSREIRVFDHLTNTLRGILSQFERKELRGQPIPMKDRSDDRYELLAKFQSILQALGFTSIVVAVDRVDEPHLVNGSAERMRDLLWPMFDNKFLKHPGLGLKLLLPAEVAGYLKREEKEFYERSRLDKQNLVLSLEWTGESLYDVANDRLKGCVNPGQTAVTHSRSVRSGDRRAGIDRHIRPAPRAAAPVQVPLSAAGGAREPLHRRQSLLEDQPRDAAFDVGSVPA